MTGAPTDWPDLDPDDDGEGDEPDDDETTGHHVPSDLIELYEVLEMDAAVKAGDES